MRPVVVPSLEEVYRGHADFVWRAARRLGLGPEAAQDIVQEVFIVLHRRLPEYDGRSAIRSWLYQITRGVVSNHRRTVDRARRRLALLFGGTDPGPEHELERRRAADAVRTFLQTLDPQKREVFALCDVEGMSAPEVSEALGVKLNTVYSRLRVARDRFREFTDGPGSNGAGGGRA